MIRLAVLLLLVFCELCFAAPIEGVYFGLEGGLMLSAPYEVSFRVDATDINGDPFYGLNRTYSIGDGVGYLLAGSLGTTVAKYFSMEGELSFRAVTQASSQPDRSNIEVDVFAVMLNSGYSVPITKSISIRGVFGIGLAFLSSEGDYTGSVQVGANNLNSHISFRNALATAAGVQCNIGIVHKLGTFGDFGFSYSVLSALPLEDMHDIWSIAVVYDDSLVVVDDVVVNKNKPAELEGFRILNGAFTATLRLFFAS